MQEIVMTRTLAGESLESEPLVSLGRRLEELEYAFTTVTPTTHAINIERTPVNGSSLRDIFGWNRPFLKSDVGADIFDLLVRANAVDIAGDVCRSRVRFATYASYLFVHSAYPTLAGDSVFFGPDTYRFIDLVLRELDVSTPVDTIFDIGCGSGACGIVLAGMTGASRVVLSDINAKALQFAGINARIAGANVECVASDVLDAVEGSADLIVSNPPYLADAAGRLYRDGGANFGSSLSVRILEQALQRLTPAGRLVLYTGTAVVDGTDVFRSASLPSLRQSGRNFRYAEIDPDVFGEQLLEPGYDDVERIAAVGLIVDSQGSPMP